MPAPPKTVYAVTFAANSVLYSLSPRSHKATRKGRTGVELTDIAFRGKTLYAISFTDLVLAQRQDRRRPPRRIAW